VLSLWNQPSPTRIKKSLSPPNLRLNLIDLSCSSTTLTGALFARQIRPSTIRRQATQTDQDVEQTIKMKHLAAYLLLTLGGNASPSASDIKSVLESVGIEADSDRLEKLISELEGKDINEVRRDFFVTIETRALG